MPNSFGSKLAGAFSKYGQLCVGIDPHAALLADWGLADSVDGLRSFANTALAACVGRVGIIKPQVSFFERFGSSGLKVLEDLATEAAKTDLVVIMDAKRGDIGTTMQAYFDAWLSKSAPFHADALTVSPYLGFDSLNDTFSQSSELGKGVFVLAATSNPEGAQLQKAVSNGKTIASQIWASLASINSVTASAGDQLGSFGAVLGATLNLSAFGLGEVTSEPQKIRTPILAPGFGAQGADLTDSNSLFGVAAGQVIHSVSRSVLQSGAMGLEKAIDSAKNQLESGLRSAV